MEYTSESIRINVEVIQQLDLQQCLQCWITSYMKHSYLSIEMATVGDKLSYKKLWWTPTDAQKHLLFYTKECLFEKYSMYSDWNIMNFYIQKPKTPVGGNRCHNGGYQLSLLSQVFCFKLCACVWWIILFQFNFKKMIPVSVAYSRNVIRYG